MVGAKSVSVGKRDCCPFSPFDHLSLTACAFGLPFLLVPRGIVDKDRGGGAEAVACERCQSVLSMP